MTTTASVYYNRIDVNYPTAARDNDSQGFRDNFNNIKLAIKATDDLVGTLSQGMVTTSTTNDFGFNTLKKVNFQDCSISIFDDTGNVRSQAVAVNYAKGSYQKFLVAGGTTSFNVINWPYRADNPQGLCGSLVLSITPESAAQTIIDFGGYVPVGETTVPFTFDSAVTAFFELWTDDGGNTVYVNQIGYKTGIVATGTTLVASDSIKIGPNTYRVGNDFETIVYTNTGSNTYVGNLAVLKNKFSTTVDASTFGPFPGNTVSNFFVVADSTSIFEGSTVYFSSTETYTVSQIVPSNSTTTNTATIYTLEDFSIQPVAPFTTGSVVTFVNPSFADLPIVLTFSTTTVSSTTGQPGDFKGTVYADTATLYVAYDDYSNTTTNWLKVYGSDYIDSAVNVENGARQLATGTTAQTVTTATDNNVLATTAFVHNVLPYGSIIMWYGTLGSVPAGWQLCDGTNSTPDLRNRFVIGAYDGTGSTTVTGSPTSTGGSKDASLVQHTHTANVTDPGHFHDSQYDNRTPAGIDYTGSGDEIGGSGYAWQFPTTTATTGITVSISTEGTVGTDKNLPPYFALCYIMKVI